MHGCVIVNIGRLETLDREFVDITDGGVSPRRLIPDGGSSPTEVSADLEVLWQTMQAFRCEVADLSLFTSTDSVGMIQE